MIFPPLPTVIPEFLNPESTATECCRKNKSLNRSCTVSQQKIFMDMLQCNIQSQFCKKLIQNHLRRLITVKYFLRSNPQIVGGFQKPTEDPDCLNPSVQKGCNISLGTELYYPNELELHRQSCHTFVATSAAALYSELLSSSALTMKQAQHRTHCSLQSYWKSRRQRHHSIHGW